MFTVLTQFKAAVDNIIDIINNEKMQILINVYNRYLIINGKALLKEQKGKNDCFN